jgi:riboflavin kinase/FMN adenylyltransferase
VKIYRSLAELPPNFGPTIATIGNFDGVHRGHQWVIAEVIARAKSHNAAPQRTTDNGQRTTSLAITLDPHPARVLGKQTNLTLITPLEEKLSLLAATGIDAALILPFDLALSHLTAREFAANILRDAAHVLEVHEGENFRFGHHAEAGTDGLAQLGTELGFTVKTYTPRALRGEAVSSSRIRKLIAAGDVSHARALLGRPFTILSTPASGRGFGTKYTVPTINLAPYSELLPANGVYITSMTIGSGDTAETFEAVTNVGNRPTFGHVPGTPDHTVESHLLNFHPIALDESTPIRLSFLKYLRAEIKWPNPEALRAQIGLDVARARRFFALCKLTR